MPRLTSLLKGYAVPVPLGKTLKLIIYRVIKMIDIEIIQKDPSNIIRRHAKTHRSRPRYFKYINGVDKMRFGIHPFKNNIKDDGSIKGRPITTCKPIKRNCLITSEQKRIRELCGIQI